MKKIQMMIAVMSVGLFGGLLAVTSNASSAPAADEAVKAACPAHEIECSCYGNTFCTTPTACEHVCR